MIRHSLPLGLNKRRLAAGLLGNRIAELARRPSMGARALRILAYHRVLDDAPAAFRFDEGVISASTEAFYNQMEFVRRNFDVIGFADLRRLESEGKPWPERGLIITFDDGYRDNYTNAFPILKQMGLPATIFLTTGHIGRASLFWWDLIAYSVKHTTRPAATLGGVFETPLALASEGGRRAAIGRILQWIKRVPEQTKKDFLDRLPGELDVALPADVADGMHLTWEEVRRMSAHGIEFGSHTVSHPVLINIGRAELEEEVSSSKRAIEENLGKEVIVFAYPVGGRQNFSKTTEDAVAGCGYRYAVSYDEGLAFETTTDRYALPRVHVEADRSLNEFRANLMFPGLMLGGRGMSL